MTPVTVSFWVGFAEITGLALLIAAVTIALVYIIARVASWAHYRTKLEYTRRVLKDINEGERR